MINKVITKMKILIMCLSIVGLIGCASAPVAIQEVKVQPSPNIMKDCLEFVEPTDGSLAAFANALFKNKSVYLLCDGQNKAKKDFIIEDKK
jgi:hypothetical protein